MVTNSITIQITILIAILITIFITIKRRPKVGSKVESDKVGLGRKVGSDREKPWFSWSKSGIWTILWSQSGQYSDQKVDLGLQVGSWA